LPESEEHVTLILGLSIRKFVILSSFCSSASLKSIYKYLALFDVVARRLTVVKFSVVRNSKFLKGYFKKETKCNFL